MNYEMSLRGPMDSKESYGLLRRAKRRSNPEESSAIARRNDEAIPRKSSVIARRNDEAIPRIGDNIHGIASLRSQ
ncbi:MAG: hypothetical protein GWO87_02475 [Xanthomonadaceae bacterium]|nr:hypothetical protein [Rhodospirillaceae bacterium]NIA18030.1 hypothetical protein [Xanthomonadaceae bacterium]